MLKVHTNKSGTVHGSYKCPELSLSLLTDGKQTTGDILKSKVEAFREGEDGVLVFSSDCKRSYTVRLDRDKDSYKVSFTKTLNIKKENMDQIESLMLAIADACTANDTTEIGLISASSSTNLLLR
jgi:hypothetical protein